jgi:predicted Ser/Thr protein kinase
LASFDVGEVILGKYEVTRVLGRGGMGVVLAAHNRELDEPVAIKLLQPTIRHDDASIDRFKREARTAARIKDPHVVRVYDFGATDDGTPYILMEYLDGHDLAAEIRQRERLPVARAVDLVLQACEAVADAHSHGVVHRDLKPANLFLTTGSDGKDFVKVLDFGVAKSSATAGASVTASHAIVGTPLYASPEQLAGSESVDERSDVWSLGVILYEMLTGEPPFPGETVAVVSKAALGGMFPKLSVKLADAPEELDRAIAQTLERNLDKRLESVRAFAAAIAPFGSKAALWSLEVIEHITERGARVEPEAAETLVEGPPSEVPAVRPRPAITAAGTPKPIAGAPPARGRSRWRAGVVVAGIGAAVVAATIAASVAIFGGDRPGVSPSTSAQAAASVAPSASSASPAASALPETGAAAPAPVCPPEEGDAATACHACRNERCCAEHLACEGSRACLDYKACIGRCSGHSCKSNCIQQHPEGHAIAAPLYACADAHCAGPCTAPTAVNNCSQCQFANCMDPAVKCFRDAACDTLDACNTACVGNEACKQKCRSQAPSGAQEMFNEFFSCKMNYCTRGCAE